MYYTLVMENLSSERKKEKFKVFRRKREEMDSRLRGNDMKEIGNDIIGNGNDSGNNIEMGIVN